MAESRFAPSQRETALFCKESKVHGVNMGPTWILSAPDGPHDGPMNLAIGVSLEIPTYEEFAVENIAGTFCDLQWIRI